MLKLTTTAEQQRQMPLVQVIGFFVVVAVFVVVVAVHLNIEHLMLSVEYCRGLFGVLPPAFRIHPVPRLRSAYSIVTSSSARPSGA